MMGFISNQIIYMYNKLCMTRYVHLQVKQSQFTYISLPLTLDFFVQFSLHLFTCAFLKHMLGYHTIYNSCTSYIINYLSHLTILYFPAFPYSYPDSHPFLLLLPDSPYHYPHFLLQHEHHYLIDHKQENHISYPPVLIRLFKRLL